MSEAGGAGAAQAGTGVINGIIGSKAANTASDQAITYGTQGLNQSGDIFNRDSGNYQPYIQGGATAESQIAAGTAPNGSLGRAFTTADFHADPGYQNDLEEGLKAIGNSNAMKGGSLSGGTLKALTAFGVGRADQAYQGAYNRFTTNQDQNFNMLNTQANRGLGATEALGQLGANRGAAIQSEYNGLGNARAAGTLGAAQAEQGAVTSMGQGITKAFNS